MCSWLSGSINNRRVRLRRMRTPAGPAIRHGDRMKRAVVLGSLLSVAVLSATLAAVQQGRQGAAGAKPVPFGQEKPSADALMVEKVRPNFYVLRGGGGNTAAFITEA